MTAVDPNSEMWPYARANAAQHGLRSLNLVNGVAEELPFPESTFDRVVCTLVGPFMSSSCHEVQK